MEEKEITLGELIHSEKFQKRLQENIKKWFDKYDEAVKRLEGKPKSNPMMRLSELGGRNVEKMTELYCDIIDCKSELPSTIRGYVKAICEPVLNEFLIEHYKKLKEADKKEAQNEAGKD